MFNPNFGTGPLQQFKGRVESVDPQTETARVVDDSDKHFTISSMSEGPRGGYNNLAAMRPGQQVEVLANAQGEVRRVVSIKPPAA